MKVIEHIAQSKKTLFSFEILPPLKGQSIKSLFDGIDPLMEFKPSFIDVTYHREEFVYKNRGNGLLEKQSIRKRPGTVGISAAIMNRYHIDAVPHIICGGFTREETENALIDLDFLGIDNVLALRGDPIKSEVRFVAEPNGHQYATELISQIVNMNSGTYIDNELPHPTATNFCIGVAAYPEKHFEAPSLDFDMRYLKKKVELGGEYVVTQLFYDNKKFFEFVRLCREVYDIQVPIIPGLKPITTKKQLTTIPRSFFIDLPDDLVKALEKAQTDAAVRQIGIEWCVQQSKELMDFGVPCLHYYSMSKSTAVKEVAESLF